MTYTLKRVIDLSEVGWVGCSITFNSFDYDEIKRYKDELAGGLEDQTKVIDLVKEKFVSGTALDENDKQVPVERDKLGELPLQIFNYCIDRLFGEPDPK